jgi:uncharacterized membrane protein
MFISALLLIGFSLLTWFFPRVVTYPLIVLLLWISLALLYRAYRLRHGHAPASVNSEAVESQQGD